MSIRFHVRRLWRKLKHVIFGAPTTHGAYAADIDYCKLIGEVFNEAFYKEMFSAKSPWYLAFMCLNADEYDAFEHFIFYPEGAASCRQERCELMNDDFEQCPKCGCMVNVFGENRTDSCPDCGNKYELVDGSIEDEFVFYQWIDVYWEEYGDE